MCEKQVSVIASTLCYNQMHDQNQKLIKYMKNKIPPSSVEEGEEVSHFSILVCLQLGVRAKWWWNEHIGVLHPKDVIVVAVEKKMQTNVGFLCKSI